MDSGGLVFVLFLCSSECPLSEEHRADVLLLLDGFNHISSEDFSKVRDFLEALVQILGVVGLDSVRIALVKCSGEPEIEFDLNTYHDVSSVVSAVKRLSQSPPSPGALTTDDVYFVQKTIFQTDRGDRVDASHALILISDRNLSSISTNTVTRLWHIGVKVFIVGVKDADYGELKDFMNFLNRHEVYTVEDFDGFPKILKELTQSLCCWIKQKLDVTRPESLRFSDVQPRRARVSWTHSSSGVNCFLLSMRPDPRMIQVLGHKRTTEIQHLRPNTSYEITVRAYESGESVPAIGRLTTQQDWVRLSGGPSRCSGSLEVHIDQMWSSVCAEDFGRAEAEVVCRELDCGGVSDLQGALFTEGSAVGRSFHCNGAETALKECESFETCCSSAANVTCTDVMLWLNGFNCIGFLWLRLEDQWRTLKTVDRDQDFDFGSALCQHLGCGFAVYVDYFSRSDPFWFLDPECVKQRSDLRDCLVHDSNSTQDMGCLNLVCSEHYPTHRITVSSEGVSQSLVHRALVRSGANSFDEPFKRVFFHLFSPSGNYTLPAVNHSANFLFSAFGPAHTVPDSHLLLRAGIHVLILLLSTTALYFYCQTTRGQRCGQL